MVCAIELGLIEPQKITSFALKLQTRRNKLGQNHWPGSRIMSNKRPAPKSNFSTNCKNPWFSDAQPNMRIKREEYSQDNQLLLEHGYSMPASSLPESSNATKARNIYYNRGNKIANETTVYNPFNAVRDSSHKSNLNNHSRDIKKEFYDDRETGPLDLTRKSIFTKQNRSPVKERFNYGNKSKTIVSTRRNHPKRRPFRHKKQKDPSCLLKNRQTSPAVETRDEEASKVSVPVARDQPHSSVIQDFSKPDIYEFNRMGKKQTGTFSALSSSDNSSESDDQDSEDVPQVATSWKVFTNEPYKKEETAKRVPPKRRYREPLWLQANKENRSSIKSPKNESKKMFLNTNKKAFKEKKKPCPLDAKTPSEISLRHKKQKDSSSLHKNRQTSRAAETSDEEASKVSLPVARDQPHSDVSQDFSKPDIYEFNRTIKNQTGPYSALSSSDNSSESDVEDSKDPQDATSWKVFCTEQYKKENTAKRVPPKRRYYEPLWLANKENSSSSKSPKDESKKMFLNINKKTVKEENKPCPLDAKTPSEISLRHKKQKDSSSLHKNRQTSTAADTRDEEASKVSVPVARDQPHSDVSQDLSKPDIYKFNRTIKNQTGPYSASSSSDNSSESDDEDWKDVPLDATSWKVFCAEPYKKEDTAKRIPPKRRSREPLWLANKENTSSSKSPMDELKKMVLNINKKTVKEEKKPCPLDAKTPSEISLRHEKQKDSSSLHKNRQTSTAAETRDEEASKVSLPVARDQPHSDVSQDFSKPDIYEFNRTIKNQTGPYSASSSSDNSSESDVEDPKDFPQDATSWKAFFTEPYKKEDTAKRIPPKRRSREPLWLANKENSSSSKSPKEESKKMVPNINKKTVKEEKKPCPLDAKTPSEISLRHKKQKDSSSLHKNRQTSPAAETRDEEASKVSLPVAKDLRTDLGTLSDVSQDFSEPDIYEFNRTVKNQTGPYSAFSSSDNSSESDVENSKDVPKDETKKILLNKKIAKEEKKKTCPFDAKTPSEISPQKEQALHLPNPANDYENSEVDETLLVDPFTDLPDALLESDEQGNEIIDLNPQFDINFDMSFGDQSTLDNSVINPAKNAGNIESEDDDFWNDQKETEERNDRSCKKVYAKKNSPVQLIKRKSADSIVSSSSGESKEKCNMKFDRITRGSIKNCAEKRTDESKWANGTVVWGNCMGWWPGLVVDASDVGMCAADGKSWVYWIAEHRISHLRDKTQIQSFSAGLRQRMIETLRVKKPHDENYAVCVATIKLLNQEILQRGPLTKPYHAWVEKHLISHENIDQLIIHPYPPKVQEKLDELKKKNFASTEKYISEMNESSDRKVTKTRSNSGEKSAVSCDPGHLPLSYQKPGVITWAKMVGQIWWPGVIIDFRDCGKKEPSFGCQWILWYGDYTLSQVNHRFFLAFEKGVLRMKEYVLNCKREVYKKGVVDAAKDFCAQYGYKTEDWTVDDVFQWFSKLDDGDESSLRRNVLPGIPGNGESSMKYPARIVEGLKKHKGNCTIAAIREHNIKDSKALKSVASGKRDLRALCLMCLKSFQEKRIDHPFFEGALCEECAEKYTPTIFAYGDDSKCFFCTICAGSDTVVMCDEQDCPRVYCTACLKYLIAPKTYNEIMLNDPFFCFLCEDAPKLLTNGLLKPRVDWKTRVAGLFHGNRDSVPNQVVYYKGGKKKLRVLSLFDGISAGLVVLNKLGIQVEAYYASEINSDAEMVSSAHFGQQIIRLGDVRTISEEKIQEIAPIHLLIGGSPCNDLSLVNPIRLGLHDPNGTGILVYEYRRIKNLIEKANDDEHFFWLFENVASMPSKYRLEINEILGREPDVIDSANYSPQHRPRLYWSNFPIVSYPLSSQDLQDVLTPNCNRHALVKKIRTVTTRVNSLKQGKDCLKPILMNEENDSLWITELEEIFGFPRHYTDVKNLCATKRQKLIGKSWSIQTIAEIMRPLCNFFQGRNEEAT